MGGGVGMAGGGLSCGIIFGDEGGRRQTTTRSECAVCGCLGISRPDGQNFFFFITLESRVE